MTTRSLQFATLEAFAAQRAASRRACTHGTSSLRWKRPVLDPDVSFQLQPEASKHSEPMEWFTRACTSCSILDARLQPLVTTLQFRTVQNYLG